MTHWDIHQEQEARTGGHSPTDERNATPKVDKRAKKRNEDKESNGEKFARRFPQSEICTHRSGSDEAKVAPSS